MQQRNWWRIALVVVPWSVWIITPGVIFLDSQVDAVDIIIGGGGLGYALRLFILRAHNLVLFRHMRAHPSEYPLTLLEDIPDIPEHAQAMSNALEALGATCIGAVTEISANERAITTWFFVPSSDNWYAGVSASNRSVSCGIRTLFEDGSLVKTINFARLRGGQHLRERHYWVSTTKHALPDAVRAHQELVKQFQGEYDAAPVTVDTMAAILETGERMMETNVHTSLKTPIRFLNIIVPESIAFCIVCIYWIAQEVGLIPFDTVGFSVLYVPTVCLTLYKYVYIFRHTPKDIVQTLNLNTVQ